jgi:hypothetical protein
MVRQVEALYLQYLEDGGVRDQGGQIKGQHL